MNPEQLAKAYEDAVDCMEQMKTLLSFAVEALDRNGAIMAARILRSEMNKLQGHGRDNEEVSA